MLKNNQHPRARLELKKEKLIKIGQKLMCVLSKYERDFCLISMPMVSLEIFPVSKMQAVKQHAV